MSESEKRLGAYMAPRLAELKPMFPMFGQLVSRVMWSSAQNLNFSYSPKTIIDNMIGTNVCVGHDRSETVGMVVFAEEVSGGDEVAIVAVIGLYTTESVEPLNSMLESLDMRLPEIDSRTVEILDAQVRGRGSIQLLYDPRDITSEVQEVMAEAPFTVRHDHQSLNAAEDIVPNLVEIAVPWVVLWTPFLKKIAERAADDVYTNTKAYIKKAVTAVRTMRRPVATIVIAFDECEIRMMFRKTQIESVEEIMWGSFERAATTAIQTVIRLRELGRPPKDIILEYNINASKWCLVHIQLADGRMIKDNVVLDMAKITFGASSLGIKLHLEPPE